jgi:hypothetical protein
MISKKPPATRTSKKNTVFTLRPRTSLSGVRLLFRQSARDHPEEHNSAVLGSLLLHFMIICDRRTCQICLRFASANTTLGRLSSATFPGTARNVKSVCALRPPRPLSGVRLLSQLDDALINNLRELRRNGAYCRLVCALHPPTPLSGVRLLSQFDHALINNLRELRRNGA